MGKAKGKKGRRQQDSSDDDDFVDPIQAALAAGIARPFEGLSLIHI